MTITLLIFSLLSLLPCLIGFQHPRSPVFFSIICSRGALRGTGVVVHAKPDGSPERSGLKGYYGKKCEIFISSCPHIIIETFVVRPSRAIEKGGGFYIPGLEDNKLRIFAASAIIALSIVNTYSVTSSTATTTQLARDPALVVSTLIGIATSALLFSQGFLQEIAPMTWRSASTDAAAQTKQQRFFQVTKDVSDDVSPILPRIASSVISAVPGVCHVSAIALPQHTLLYEISSLPESSSESLTRAISQVSVEGEKMWSNDELSDVTHPLSQPQTIVTKTTSLSNGRVLWVVGVDRSKETLQSDVRARRSMQCLTSLLSLPVPPTTSHTR